YRKKRSRPGDGFAGKRGKNRESACGRWSGRGVWLLVGRLLRLVAAALMTHGLKLLHLIGSEDGCELRLGVLVNGAELLATLIGGEAGVGAESGYLLLLGGQDRLELHSLIAGEVETLAQMLC